MPSSNTVEITDRLFRRFIELANDVVYAMDLQGNLVYVSPKWSEIFGNDPQEVVGQYYAPLIHPEDLPHCMQALKQTMARQVKQNDIQYRIRHADASWHHQSSNIAPLLDDGGQLVGVLGIGRDINAQKQAEERQRLSEDRYRLLADYASDVIWTMELDGTISYLSPSIERARGLTVDEAISQPLNEALAPESLAQVGAYFQKLKDAIERKQPIEPFRGDMQYYRKDGSVYWGEVLATPSFDAAGNFRQIVGVTRDINERKAQQAELKRANDELASVNLSLAAANAELSRHREHLEALVLERTRHLAAARDAAEQANLAKSVLLANMSHELRTPLNHILGFAGILKRDISNPKGLDRLEKMTHSAAQLLRLIDGLLDTARLESMQLVLEGTDFELSTLLDRVRAQPQLALAARSLTLECDIAADLAQCLHGDLDRVTQVLSELIDNAIKFSSVSPVVLRVTQQSTGACFVTLRFEVQDRGIGIPIDVQANMFQVFIQGDGSSTRRYGGTGIGLALCQRLVNLMAGEIGFASAPGEGSLFWVEIPFAQVSRSASPQSMDIDQARSQLNKLLELLHEGDVSALPLWTEMSAHAEYLLEESLFLLEDALENYEYERAAEYLAKAIGSA